MVELCDEMGENFERRTPSVREVEQVCFPILSSSSYLSTIFHMYISGMNLDMYWRKKYFLMCVLHLLLFSLNKMVFGMRYGDAWRPYELGFLVFLF